MSLHHPAQNHLLAALSTAGLERLRPDLDVVPMPSGRVVHEEGLPQQYVYFPTGSIIALLYAGMSGAPGRAVLVGREGLIGAASLTGGDRATGQAVVQSSGYAYRMPSAVFDAECRRPGRLRDLTLAYTKALTAQMRLVAVCQRCHSLEQQVCRWLLSSVDRLDRPRLVVGLGAMLRILGAPHERVLNVLAMLQARGLVRFDRGAIEILDRDGVVETACDCYGSVAGEYDRLLGTGFVRPSRLPPPARIAAAAQLAVAQ